MVHQGLVVQLPEVRFGMNMEQYLELRSSIRELTEIWGIVLQTPVQRLDET